MKKLKYLVLLLAVMLVLPFTVFAEGEEGEGDAVVTGEDGGSAEEVDQRAIVYFFRGEGCPHCQEAEAWFATIQEEYGSRFILKDYETWYDEENATLMSQISEARNDNATGVPYIIIGDKSWIGFSETTMADEIKAQIDQVYAQPVSERYDALSSAGLSGSGNPGSGNGNGNGEGEEESSSNDVVGLIIILVVAGGVGFGLYSARKHAN